MPREKVATRRRGRPPAPPEGTREAQLAGDVDAYVVDSREDDKMMVGVSAVLQRQRELGPDFDPELLKATQMARELGFIDERTALTMLEAERQFRFDLAKLPAHILSWLSTFEDIDDGTKRILVSRAFPEVVRPLLQGESKDLLRELESVIEGKETSKIGRPKKGAEKPVDWREAERKFLTQPKLELPGSRRFLEGRRKK